MSDYLKPQNTCTITFALYGFICTFTMTLVHLFLHLVFEAFKFITPITAVHNSVYYGNHCLCFNSQAYSMTKKKKNLIKKVTIEKQVTDFY